MKLNLFLLCLTGVAFITLQAARLDYFLITTPATWEYAKDYCRSNYEDLAWVQTADNWYRLTAEAERKGLPVTGWIGLYNKMTWVWINYGLGNNSFPFNWAPGQPDNFGGNETCAAMDSSGSWLDYTCTELKPSLCYDDTIQGFAAVSNPIGSWHQSYKYCSENHVGLAVPLNDSENSELQQLVLTQGTSWIGVFRLGWCWTNGSIALELPWRPGHPNNAEQHNNCASLNNSLIEDKLCKNKFNFFCHKQYTVKMQVMRLNILGDNQVFDPATQTTILQKIKQKLKDHGITREMNVAWRVHADGNIIHKKRNNRLEQEISQCVQRSFDCCDV